ncbi:MAG: hypothetical protein RMX68_024265 [Aulosira sp. ZfuVER01]|nr:hypothetical protein [Aulosira sp. DedVER01a]MDZ8050303.1 hypothetical protein [Aulosira sp. ZfuCHP01]
MPNFIASDRPDSNFSFYQRKYIWLLFGWASVKYSTIEACPVKRVSIFVKIMMFIEV